MPMAKPESHSLQPAPMRAGAGQMNPESAADEMILKDYVETDDFAWWTWPEEDLTPGNVMTKPVDDEAS